eukprot:Gregarina_sp_Poly_1__8127@NODE_469_length_8155_cov_116_696093_g381_i0_p1_GENE_NODE_469_length_8155_cov_116_696093_g381_i0NODE_469_length_8155_cov_116_696093_g381_i0_p1_ORF_typecomplete_len1774_score267_84PPR_long/PF17177_4/1_7e03PPR_long/PF17177_4/6_1e03PPR_long/PF17177_4/7_6e18PPR_long/PF17177_4/8_3e17PPR_long/PF17177_4/8_6e13PPR_long/PF17177_4/2_7e37PPR_long/PF17177_4/8_9e18PPR_3/PF13812_6/1_1e03PPR_3/PF13812_6/8_5e03PPR_3/PF13812_6/0_0002PPR_3/PF13812_6/0_02PPR_3/PF13812_6/2e09PPR_3/PF13812_6
MSAEMSPEGRLSAACDLKQKMNFVLSPSSRHSESLNLMAKELTHTLLGPRPTNTTSSVSPSHQTDVSTTSSSPVAQQDVNGCVFFDNFPACSNATTETAASCEPGAPDEVVSEAVQELRAAVMESNDVPPDWRVIYHALARVVKLVGDRSPQRTLHIAMMAEMNQRQGTGASPMGRRLPLTYDTAGFSRGYASLWYAWHVSGQDACLAPPQPLGGLSPGAVAIRSIIYGAQRLCLSALATSTEMAYRDRQCCRQIALAGLSRLAWHDECLEALAGVFFEIEGKPERDTFANYIVHWNATGVLQKVFEVFTLALARTGKWRALLWLLCYTRDVAHKLVSPALATKERFVSPVLPEAGILKACRPDLLRGMRFPVVAIVALIHELCNHLSETVEWPFITSPSHVVQSVLPLALGKMYCEETCVSYLWHAQVFTHSDNKVTECTEILEMIQNGSLVADDRDLFINGKEMSVPGIDLSEILSSYMFKGDPKLGPLYDSFLVEAGNPLLWLTGVNDPQLEAKLRHIWGLIGEGTKSQERFYALLELCSRMVEGQWLISNKRPAVELMELCEESVSVMNLEAARRTVAQLTGCQLGRIEIYLLKILEAYDTSYGVASDLPGLVGPPRKFNKVLELSPTAVGCLLSPVLSYGLPSSSVLCLNLKLAPSKEAESTRSHASAASRQIPVGDLSDNDPDSEALIFPTLLPVHVARYIPAWFSTRGNIAALFGDDNRQYVGWRTVCLECLCAAVQDFNDTPCSATNRKIAPHINDENLLSFLKLYVEAANPRCLHLLTRWVSYPSLDESVKISELQNLLRLAEASKFGLLADAIAYMLDISNSVEIEALAPALVAVYVAAADGPSANLVLKQLRELPIAYHLELTWRARIDELISKGARFAMEHEAQLLAQGRSVRWHKAVQAVKGFSAVNGVENSIAFFRDLRKSPGGIPDISIANKIIHICIANNKLAEAESLFKCLRQDAHKDAGQISLGPHSVVKPDIVTCNILLKGLAKKKPPQVEEIETFIAEMETPFHMGGDGVVADQVTFNTAINAAISAGSFEKAWEFLTTMKRRGIKVDGYTCSILMKQVGPSSRPEVVSEILRLLGELDLFEDPVLLSSVVDVCSRLRDFSRLRMTLERYEVETENPTPYALATLVKGYGRCGMIHKASALWDKLEQTPNVEWSQYIFGCAVDCFVTNGNLDKALAVFHKATRLNALLSDSQTTMLIRACTQRRRLQDALKLYRQMREHHLHLCDVTCNNLMHMCVTAGDLDTAMQILEDMSQNPMHQPDVVTYSTIIKGLCDCGAMKTAMQMFEELPQKGLKPDIVTYNTLLEGFAKSEDLAQVENLFNQLIANNVKPTCYTLTILIKFYGRRHKLDKALHLVETLPKLYGIRMDAFVFTATIAACTWNGRVDKAIVFLQAMRQSFGASARTYGTLVAGCVKQQTWESLSLVLDCATEDKISLGKRDASSLQELAQNWSQCALNQKWIMSGFNEEAAIRIQKFLAQQQQTRLNANSMRRL